MSDLSEDLLGDYEVDELGYPPEHKPYWEELSTTYPDDEQTGSRDEPEWDER